MINVAIVDDHKIFLNAVETFLAIQHELSVVFTSDSCESLINFLENESENKIDVLLLDLKLKGMSGFECLDILSKHYPDIRVIILTMFGESAFLNQAIKKGAKSFVTKEVDTRILLKSIQVVFETGYYLDPLLSKLLIENIVTKQDTATLLSPKNILTKGEMQVLQYLCQGFTAEEIGKTLFRSRRTIEGHKQRLLDKTNLKNTTALVAWAFREGLVS